MKMQTADRRNTTEAGREALLVRLGIVAVAVHLFDDAFLQPEAGTSAGDHLVSGGVPIALLVIGAASFPRLRAGFRAWLALAIGLLATGTGAAVPAYHTVTEGPAGDDYTGLVAMFGGLMLVVVAATTMWRSRRTDERRRRRYARRVLTGAAALVVAFEVVAPVGIAFVMTHLPRAAIAAADLGAVHEDVTLTTSDGLALAGWYVPSRNGAAVIVFPGRSGPLDHARMLVRHGYGVLLLDRRGNGESQGDGIVTGWNGDKDVLAAIDFLAARPDVTDGQIGGLGLSVGGEILLQTAAKTDRLRAVVSEGAGARSLREQRHDMTGDAWALLPQDAMFMAATMVFAGQVPPPYLADLVGRITASPIYFIYATDGQGGEALNPVYYEAAGGPKEIWAIGDAGHTDGLSVHPEEYERRVTAFFDAALLGAS